MNDLGKRQGLHLGTAHRHPQHPLRLPCHRPGRGLTILVLQMRKLKGPCDLSFLLLTPVPPALSTEHGARSGILVLVVVVVEEGKADSSGLPHPRARRAGQGGGVTTARHQLWASPSSPQDLGEEEALRANQGSQLQEGKLEG